MLACSIGTTFWYSTPACQAGNAYLERWLLGDPNGIEQDLGPRAKVNKPASATLECKPKEIIKDIFRKADKEFVPYRDNERIAERIDLKIVVKNNKSFCRFQKQVKDP
jgi:hypothetical protein